MGYYSDEIKRLQELEEHDKQIEGLHKSAQSVRDTYQSFVNVGFTEEQAYEILTIYLKK